LGDLFVSICKLNKFPAQNQQPMPGEDFFAPLCFAFPLPLYYLRVIKSIKYGTDSITIAVVGEFRQPARGFEDD
jgi:hypothetical protein